MIRTLNFQRQDFESDLIYLNETEYEFLTKSKVFPGDILMNKIADPGTVYLMPDLHSPVSLAMNLFLIRFKNSVDQKFMYYLMHYYEPYIKLFSNGAATLTITKDSVKKLTFNVPEFHDQQKIAHILSAYDDLIENNLKRIKLLEEMAQITYEQWFVHLKFPEHETTPIDAETGLPEGWNNIPLSEAVSVNPTTRVSNKQESPFVPMRSLSTNSMVVDDIEFRTPSGGAKFINGDTLVARITPCLENGKTGFVNFLKDGEVATGSTEFIVLRETLNINRYFIYCMSRSEYFRELSIRSMAGSDGRQRVNPKIYNKMMLLIPSSKTMELFGKKMRPIFNVIYSLVNQNQYLKEARDILLPRLMTGMINVDHIELPIIKQETEAA